MSKIDLKYLANEIYSWAQNRKAGQVRELPSLKLGDEIEYIIDAEDADFDKEEMYLSIVAAIADLDVTALYTYKVIKLHADKQRAIEIMQHIEYKH